MRNYTLNILVAVLPLAVLALGGCSSELETGYRPQKIGVTTEERRAYYAPAFSPEAEAGKEGDANLSKARRPY